jgi:hypothetical protein
MSQLLFANNAQSNLAGPITSTSTTLNLTTGSGVLFPVPGAGQLFKVTLTDAATGLIREIMHCTAVSGDALTVIRAQEGTTAVAWLAGDLVGNLLTAGSMGAFAQTATLPASVYSGTDQGTANALSVPTTSPAISAPVAGQIFLITKSASAGANTASVTLQVGTSPTNYSVVYNTGSGLAAGDWPAATTALLYFTGGVFQVLTLGGIQPPQNSLVHSGVDSSSTANTITATVSPAITGYVQGSVYYIKLNNTITGASTINISGLGSKTVTRIDGTSTQSGDALAGEMMQLSYDGTNMQIVGLNPILIPGTYFRDFVTAGTTSVTLPAGAYFMEVWGAGGGGGGCLGANSAGSGGGGGEYRAGRFNFTVPTTINVTVGAAGAAGTTAPTNGSAGGASSIGSLMTAIGGGGGYAGNGAYQNSQVGAGGSGGSGGSVDLVGYGGGFPYSNSGTPVSGQGGPSGNGGTYTLINITTASGATPGSFPGGGASAASGSGGLAAAGASGRVTIRSA